MSRSAYDVFLSYSRDHELAVEELARRLVAEGVEVWLDRWNLIPGVPWLPEIERVLAECLSCAIIIGPGGLGTWQHEEMCASVTRRVTENQGRFRVIPVLLPGVERPERSKLPAFLVATTWVEFRETLDDAEAFRRLVCGIRGLEPGPRQGMVFVEGECPYRGLEAFDAAHARFFYGREALTEWLLNALRPAPGAGQENRFLGIIGASGSGKSSLARAGLIPALARGGLEGSHAWPIVTCRPGPDPLESLAVALTALAGESTPQAVQGQVSAFKQSERTLHLATRLGLREVPPGHRLVVLIDQFEEVFTLCDDEPARRALIDNLLYAATVAQGQTVAVLTMRADFYGRCATYPALAAALSDHQVLVGPMTEDELRRAIECPARLVGCDFEPGLVDTLVGDVRGRIGALPLLQYALLELWKHRHGHRLSHDEYRTIGQVKGAIAKTADTLFAHLGAHEQERVRDIFIRLTRLDSDTALSEDRRDARRRVRLHDLTPTPEEAPETIRLVNCLTDARLTVTTINPRTGGREVELAHEALILHWPRLRAWLDQDRTMLRLREEIGDAARDWGDHQENEAYLIHRGDRLRTVESLLDQRTALLRADELRYLRACVALRKAEFDARRRATFLRRLTLTAIPGLIIVVLAIGLWGAWRDTEEQARHLKVMKQTLYAFNLSKVAEIAGNDPALGLKKLGDTDDFPPDLREFTWSYLRRRCQPYRSTLEEHTEDVVSVAFSPDGRTLASASKDGTIKLWDGATGKVSYTIVGSEQGPSCVKFSTDGRMLAFCGGDPTIRLWDVVERKELAPLAWHEANAICLDFAPDGKTLASGSEDGAVKLWSIAGRKERATIAAHTERVNSVVFSRDGRMLATGGADSMVKLWGSSTGQPQGTLKGHKDQIWSLAFAPDGTLASGSEDGTVLLWNTAKGQARATLEARGGDVFAVAFSCDGRTLASGTQDSFVTLWDVAEARRRTVLQGHVDVVFSLAFSPDGETLASAGGDNKVRIWDAAMRPEQATLPQGEGQVLSVTFSPDGRTLAAAGGETLSFLRGSLKPVGELRMWDMTTGEMIAARRKHSAWICSVAFSADGQMLASGSWEPRIGLWDGASGEERGERDKHGAFETLALCLVFTDRRTLAVASGTKIEFWDVDKRELQFALAGHTGAVFSLAVSADRRILASGSQKGEIKLWDLASGKVTERVTLHGPTTDVLCVAFSHDGRTLAWGGADNTIRLWDVATRQERETLSGHSGVVLAVAFSPDGRTVASGSGDNTVRLWDAATGTEMVMLTAHSSAVRSVAFDPGGKILASGSLDGIVKLWGVLNGDRPVAFGPRGSSCRSPEDR